MAYANLDGLGWLVEDMQTWTAAQIAAAATHYEPKLRFDSTPVYSVTLAEDVEVSSSNSYRMILEQSYDYLWVVASLSAALSANATFLFKASENSFLTTLFRSTGTMSSAFVAPVLGGKLAFFYGGSSTNGSKTFNCVEMVPNAEIGKFSEVDVRMSSGTLTIPAGTTFTIYAAQEV